VFERAIWKLILSIKDIVIVLVKVIAVIIPAIIFTYIGFDNWAKYYNKKKTCLNFIRYSLFRYVVDEAEHSTKSLNFLIGFFCMVWAVLWLSFVIL